MKLKPHLVVRSAETLRDPGPEIAEALAVLYALGESDAAVAATAEQIAPHLPHDAVMEYFRLHSIAWGEEMAAKGPW